MVHAGSTGGRRDHASALRGLTQGEVEERRARGEVNRVTPTTSRPIIDILRSNFLTLFNAILAAAVLALVVVGQYRDAVLTSGLVVFSVAISTVQEIRAKYRLDRIALLSRAPVKVIRDGQELAIDPDELVLGDYLVLARGEAVVADGRLVWGDQLEVDESLLTGESDPVSKNVDDKVYSGSFCVAGSGVYVAEEVGETSYAQRLAAAARTYRQPRTPTQLLLDRVLRFLLVVVASLAVIQWIVFLIGREQLVEAVRASAVIATLVPQGLLLMSTVAYSVGALRLAQTGALIQQLNAVESLSHVDVLCLDKTGTLTANRLRLYDVIPLDGAVESIKAMLAAFAASFPEPNATLLAVGASLPGTKLPLADIVPFSSERRWSGLTFAPPSDYGTVIIGAPEALKGCLGVDKAIEAMSGKLAATGKRVLLVAQSQNLAGEDASGRRTLPVDLRVLGIVTLEEEIRPDAAATLDEFEQNDVAVKVISGDNPQTVEAVAQRVGLPEPIVSVSGAELADLNPQQLSEASERASVFGRILPQNKQDIIRALRDGGHYVAMIGDGVNDVLALKQANVGVAMRSGSAAARAVADVVLLNDTFSVLPAALCEGRRVINAMLLLIKLFLIRDAAMIELILFSIALGVPFPLLPPHAAVTAFLTVGLPSLLIVAWASTDRPRPVTMKEIAVPVLALGTTSGLAIASVFWLVLMAGGPLIEARAAVVTAALIAGACSLVLFWHPLNAPTRQLFSDLRIVAVAVLDVIIFAVVVQIPPLARVFELSPLSLIEWVIIIAVVMAWFGVLRLIVRLRPISRWIG